ncbi:PAS domain S-box protein [Pseudoalteromonas sp. SWXJZ94C]|nr:PAS domain S-box protein [Pseudoalteromonas sp. SWXJZ94C]
MNYSDKKSKVFSSSQLAILLYAIMVGILVTCLMIIIVFHIDSQERIHIERVTQSTAEGIKTLLKDDLEERITSLSELSKLSSISSDMPQGDWEIISKTLYDSQYGYQAIGWIDRSLHVRKIIPKQGNEIAIDFNLALNPPALLAAIKAQNTKQAVVTTPLQSIHGGEGLGIYIPVFNTNARSKKLEGFIASALIFEPYIKTVVPAFLLKEYHFTLFIDGQKVYSDQANSFPVTSIWDKKASYDLQGHKWEISISPSDEFLYIAHYKIMRILISLGIFIAFLIVLAAYTYLFARSKIKDGRYKIEYLLKNLPGMAYQSFNTMSWPMILVSDGCESLTGYSRAEFKKNRMLWREIIHLDDYERVQASLTEAVKEKRSFELEYRINTKNSGIKLVWEKGGPVRSIFNGEVIIEGFINDITSIKQAEADLISSYAFSDAVVNSVVEAVITIDQYGLIQSFNFAAQAMFGYTSDEVKDKNVTILMPTSFSKHHDQHLAQYLKTKQTHIIGVGRELVAKHKDGTTFPIHLSVSEIQNHESTMFVGLIRDITKQRASEDQARLHTEQLAHTERVNALGEMAAGIAHEINQPLTAISLFSQTAKNFCEKGRFDKLPLIFEKLSLHSRRAGAVIERMQLMTKKGQRTKEVIDCIFLIKEVTNLAESEARLRNITVRIITCDEQIDVFVDRVQIEQVILNLLRNGMEAMQLNAYKNDSKIELEIKLNGDKYVEISVSDTGAGLPEEMREKLFKPFSSTKENGTGIGLSISKSIVEEHGGHIHFYDNKPTGAIFMFTLPAHNRGVVYER